MLSNVSIRVVLTFLCLLILQHGAVAQRTTTTTKKTTTTTTTTSASTTASATTSSLSNSASATNSPTITSASGATTSAPDVYLNVPTLSVGRIELDVDDLQANINLNAQVASLVTLNAGVAVSIQTVNLTISDVDANLELIVRLGNLVNIVNRVFQSLDLNPLLINTLNNVTSILEPIVGEVAGLLGSITQGGTTLSFLVDNLGNIVQEVGGVSSIVGNYLQNMTDTGVSQTLSGGLIEKTFSYSPLNALVDIVFNAAGQVVQATVATTGAGATATSSSSAAASTASASSASTTAT
ncbi:hypothetical protein EDD36DRAFT_192290 [Exophiala viscosa]|uniref:Uncharacterized protein n=1 Tax=Exophiala viscosa TaxID=2486360 RepID=A0AAN6E1L5_9EURO|nr:hypothetical protein EDD36DRAFT_192290 [Exophiala viscosa]